MDKNKKCLVLLSGGMDSATLLGLCVSRFKETRALTIHYGQRHNIEIASAKEVANHFQVSHLVMDLSVINTLLQGSALTSPGIDVPHGHYEDETMRLTVVPARNSILLSLALGYAVSLGFETVAYAAHAGDHAIYPDCRPEFVEAMRGVFRLAHYYPVDLFTPFLNLKKNDILDLGFPIGVPYEKTWTCYDPQPDPDIDRRVDSIFSLVNPVLACGKCGSCQERLEAFEIQGKKDPVKYVGGVV